MFTETIRGMDVTVIRKPIKNLHLGVYPPDGHIRVAAPENLSEGAVRTAIVRRLGWIRRQQAKFRAQPRESRREMVSGESHWYLGRRYCLRVTEAAGPARVTLKGRFLELRCRPGTTRNGRAQLLDAWYRGQLRAVLAPFIEEWAERFSVEISDWRVRRMKTKWASCNREGRRLWFNSELAKKPRQAIEYVVVHEMAHLRERRHDAQFLAVLDEHLPHWRLVRDELGRLPLASERWDEAPSGPTS